MRYLYTAWLPPFGGTCEARLRGFAETGRELTALAYSRFFPVLKPTDNATSRLETIEARFGFGPGIWRYNRQLMSVARQYRPDVIWIDKGHYVFASTLRKLKQETNAVLVCYNTDDIGYGGNGWRLHFPGVPEYDLYFTTNRFNVEELGGLGARQVILTRLGYDRDLCKPQPVEPDEAHQLGAPVGFIGHWEPATEMLILQAVRRGLPLRVRGQGWERMRHKHELQHVVEPRILRGSTYVKALISTKVNLGINSAQSRNLSSGRSFEIPAAGGFLLAQRTLDHRMFYEEGKEAEFFDSAEEVVEKARYYLEHEEERMRIAAAGHRRCLTSRYSWQELVADMVQTIEDRGAPLPSSL